MALDNQTIEHLLIPRLKVMGFILVTFSLIAFTCALIPQEEELEQEILTELSEEPPLLNMFLVSGTLAMVGTACVFIAWRKRNAIKNIDR